MKFIELQIFYYTKFFRVICMCIVIEMVAYEMESWVCAYHVYEDLWDVSIREDILCEREPFNDEDRYVVVVRKIPRIYSLFLARSGAITCTCIGGRRYSYS